MSGLFSVNSNFSSPLTSVGSERNATASARRQDLAEGGKILPQPGARESKPALPVTKDKAAEISVDSGSSELRFDFNEATGDTVLTVQNAQTGELVRQIPSKEKLAIAQYIEEISPNQAPGQLVDDNE